MGYLSWGHATLQEPDNQREKTNTHHLEACRHDDDVTRAVDSCRKRAWVSMWHLDKAHEPTIFTNDAVLGNLPDTSENGRYVRPAEGLEVTVVDYHATISGSFKHGGQHTTVV